MQAENLEAKDANGFSDPYCMLGIRPKMVEVIGDGGNWDCDNDNDGDGGGGVRGDCDDDDDGDGGCGACWGSDLTPTSLWWWW